MLVLENKMIAGKSSMVFISDKDSYIQTEDSRVFLFIPKEDLTEEISPEKIKESIKFDGRNYIIDRAISENRALKLLFSHNNQDPEDLSTWSSYTKDVVRQIQETFSLISEPLIENNITCSFWTSAFEKVEVQDCLVYKLNRVSQDIIDGDIEGITLSRD